MCKWHLVAAIFSVAYATSIDLTTSGATMRKQQDGGYGHRQASASAASGGTVSISVGQRGSMLDENNIGLRSAKVRAHDASKPKSCATACTLNVKIASTRRVNSSDLDYKTMRLKSCKDETFHFDGCDQSTPQAMICTNSERKPTGVRVLKNSRLEVVGYGSCCIPGLSDKVVSTSLASCESTGSNLISEGKTIVTQATLHATDDGVHHNLTELWDVVPPKVTSIEDGLAKFRFMPMLTVGVTMGSFAIAYAIMVMYSHLKTGARITGSFRKVHSSSATFVSLLWTVPVFTALGILGTLLPEMAAVWQFCQALLLTATLRKMPAMFLKVGGGRLHMERTLQTTGEQEPMHIFSHGPLACLWFCVPAKTPEIADIADLELAVAVACFAMPCFSFLEMVCTLEAQLPAEMTHPTVAAFAPGAAIFVRMMEVTLIAIVMAALRGLAALVQALNPKAAKNMSLSAKSTYCQCFLGGLRLLPILYHLLQCIWCGEYTQESRRFDAARSILVCVASMVCTWTMVRAFPVDAHHYPELKAAMLTQSQPLTGCLKLTLKPVLDVVQFCPFCGSSDLTLEENATDSAACPHCSARQVPANLICHRIVSPADVSSSTAGQWLAAASSGPAGSKGTLNIARTVSSS